MDRFNLSPINAFKKRVLTRPEDTIVVDKNQRLSAKELDQFSNKLATFFYDKGLRPGDKIGLLLNKDIRAIITILAAWKLKCPYVPLLPETPADRVQYVFNKCKVKYAAVVEGIRSESHVELWETIENYQQRDLSFSISEDDLAYIMFTSGSTGLPKGVPITQKQLSYYSAWCVKELGVSSKDKVLNSVNFNFDVSLMDFCFTFACNAELHLFSEVLHPRILSEYIAENKISILSSVPTTFHLFFDPTNKVKPENLRSLSKIFVGGAAFHPSLLEKFSQYVPEAKIYNIYGPTEATIYCSYHEFTKDEVTKGLARIPLGKALPEHNLYLVDANRQVVQERGELVINGPQVMSGYLEDQDLSDRVLRWDDLKQCYEYFTGDIVEKDAEGNLYFVGRLNETIKTAGYRVDLGDIENTLSKYEDVVQIAVVPVADRQLENKLVVFAILQSEQPGIKGLIDYAKKHLISYMLPHYYFILQNMPIGTTGKIDKKKLCQEAEIRLSSKM